MFRLIQLLNMQMTWFTFAHYNDYKPFVCKENLSSEAFSSVKLEEHCKEFVQSRY